MVRLFGLRILKLQLLNGMRQRSNSKGGSCDLKVQNTARIFGYDGYKVYVRESSVTVLDDPRGTL